MNTSAVSPGRAGLLLLLSGQMLPLIDTSITNVALDAITHTLAASATQLELIVALYGVAFAVCLAMGSKLGDNYGRRRLFMWGVALFGIASLLCGIANSIGALLAARTLQGAGAALIVPQILATLHVTLKGPAHARAISLYGGIGGIAFIVGQMGGGWLVSADIAGLGWRNAFFINVPICLLVLALSRRYVPETRRETPSRIDWQGTLYLALILCCLLFPMALGPELHWPLWLQLMLVAVLPLLFAMRQSALRQQQRGDHPLLPPRLLQLTSIRFGMAIALLFFSAWSGFMFCMALTMQEGLGMAPWQSGNSFIALGVAYFISALYAPRLIARLQHGADPADRSGGADRRTPAAVRHLLPLRRRHQRPDAGSRHGADRLWPGADRQQLLSDWYARYQRQRRRGRERNPQHPAAGDPRSRTGYPWFAVPGAGPSRRRKLSAGAD